MNNKSYAKYHFAKLFFLLPLMTIVLLLFSGSIVTSSYFSDYVWVSLAPIGVLIFGFSIVVPLAEHHGFNNKRNLDTLYSLPISRKALFIIHYLNGLVYIIVALLIVSIAGFIEINDASLNVGYYFQYIFLELLFVIALYSFMTLAVVVGNSNRDAFGLEIMYIACSEIILSAVGLVANRIVYGRRHYFETTPIDNYLNISPSTVSGRIMTVFADSIEDGTSPKINYFGYVIFVLIGLASAYGAYYVFTHKKAEKVEEVTTSLLGFTTLIPATTLALFVMTYSGYETVILRLIILAFTYVAYAIQCKSPKIGKVNLIVMGVLGVLAIMPFDFGF